MTRVVRERGISTQIAISFVDSASSRVSRVNFASVAGKFRRAFPRISGRFGVSRFDFGVPFRVSRVPEISVSAYPGCQKSASPGCQKSALWRVFRPGPKGGRREGATFCRRRRVELVQLFSAAVAARTTSARVFFPGRFFGCASLVGAPAGGRAGGVALKSITSKGTPFEGSHPRGCAPRGARRGGQLQSGTSKRNRGTLRIPEADPPRGTRRGGPPRRAPRGGMDELF